MLSRLELAGWSGRGTAYLASGELLLASEDAEELAFWAPRVGGGQDDIFLEQFI